VVLGRVEMTQTLYAHMNKKINKNFKNGKEENEYKHVIEKIIKNRTKNSSVSGVIEKLVSLQNLQQECPGSKGSHPRFHGLNIEVAQHPTLLALLEK
jgi:hypothetical protein